MKRIALFVLLASTQTSFGMLATACNLLRAAAKPGVMSQAEQLSFWHEPQEIKPVWHHYEGHALDHLPPKEALRIQDETIPRWTGYSVVANCPKKFALMAVAFNLSDELLTRQELPYLKRVLKEEGEITCDEMPSDDELMAVLSYQHRLVYGGGIPKSECEVMQNLSPAMFTATIFLLPEEFYSLKSLVRTHIDELKSMRQEKEIIKYLSQLRNE